MVIGCFASGQEAQEPTSHPEGQTAALAARVAAGEVDVELELDDQPASDARRALARRRPFPGRERPLQEQRSGPRALSGRGGP